MRNVLIALILPLALLLAYAVQPLTSPRAQAQLAPVETPTPVIPASNRPVPLHGSTLPTLTHARRLGSLQGNQTLTLAIGLRIRDQAALNRLLKQIYDSHSALYHHFLSPKQFAERFGATPYQERSIAAWLASKGLRVIRRFPNRLELMIRGRADQVSSAFHTPLYHYQLGKAKFFANAATVKVPERLAPSISAVSGLSNAPAQKPVDLRSHSTAKVGDGPSGGYTPSELQKLYDVSPLVQQGDTGQGQTIGIVALADFDQSHIDTFDQQFGISPPAPQRVPVSDGNGGGATLGDGQDETEMDIEVVQGMAPAANIRVYEASNTSAGSISLWNQVVSENRAKVVTTSWGTWETNIDGSELNATHSAMQEAAAQGQSVFAASGDNGAYDQAQDPKNGDPTVLSVDYPSSDPFVTGVGGTTLIANPDGSYLQEGAWSDGSDPKVPIGTGGGLSDAFDQPSYQSGPGVNNKYSNGKRQVPDVAALAAGEPEYAIYTIHDRGVSWGEDGGTSASAPLWAGFTAILNQNLGKPVGFLNPTLYSLGQNAGSFAHSPFHDVTRGTNLYYPATTGWDFATGWGSFDGKAMADAIRGSGPPPSPTATKTRTSGPTPTPTRISGPEIVIDKIGISHKLKGKDTATKALVATETGTFFAIYHQKNAAGQSLFGSVTFTRNGKRIGIATMYNGLAESKTALVADSHFSNKQTGKVKAAFSLQLGPARSSKSTTFTVKALTCKKGLKAKNGKCVRTSR